MASEIRVNKINSRTGVGTITLSPTGVDFTGIATVATLKATAGIVTTLTTTGNATVGGTLGVTGETTFTTHINFGDNAKAIFGNGSDLQIYHDTSGAGNSIVKEEGTGELRLGSNSAVRITKHDSETCALFTVDGAAELYYDNSKKFETTTNGVTVTGRVACDEVRAGDNDKIQLGDSQDFRVYHDGSTNIIDGHYHPIELRHQSEVHAKFVDDGAVELYHNNVKKLETTSNGVKVGSNTLVTPSTDADNFVIDTGDADSGLSILSSTTGRIYFGDASNNDTGSIRYVHSDNSMRFETNDEERMRIHSGGTLSVPTGIELGSGLDGTSANTLDDYEEGTWTPGILRSTTNPTVATSYANGKYTKVGNQVLIYWDMNITTLSGGSGRYYIYGLPFATSTASASGGYGAPQFRDSTAFPLAAQQIPSSYHSSTTIQLRYMSDATTESDIAVTTGRITGWSVYFTNA